MSLLYLTVAYCFTIRGLFGSISNLVILIFLGLINTVAVFFGRMFIPFFCSCFVVGCFYCYLFMFRSFEFFCSFLLLLVYRCRSVFISFCGSFLWMIFQKDISAQNFKISDFLFRAVSILKSFLVFFICLFGTKYLCCCV